MKHTPGSWVAGKEVPSDPHETEHVVKAGPFYIASVHRMIGMSEHDDQTIPNARLIAAAPELLEACKHVIDCGMECPGCTTMLRAAIAKAEGRTK